MTPFLYFLSLAYVFTSAAGKMKKTSVVVAPFVKPCCDYQEVGGEDLYSCVMEGSDLNVHHLRGVFRAEIAAHAQKKYRFGIVTFATQSIWDYAAYAVAVNEVYAEQNSYIFKVFDDTTHNYKEPDARWSKVKILEDALDPNTEWSRELDYVVWVDADVIFMDPFFDLDKLVRSTGDTIDIIASAEHIGGSTLINSGTVIAKKTKWAKNFTNWWWTHKSRSLYSDQESFDMIYRLMTSAEQKDHVAVLAPDAINSDPPAMEKQQSHNKVMHLMGEHSPFRIKVFGTAFDNLCKNMNDPKQKLPPQLGVHQANLLQWTTEIYKQEMMELLAEYEPKAKLGLNSMKDTKMLSNSIHHYCHGIKTRNKANDVEIANTLRNMSFWLAYRNFNNRRAINKEYAESHGTRMEPDWPEHLKAVATMGRHLSSLGTFEQRRAAIALNLELLTELYYLAHDQQKAAIDLMIASTEHSLALVEVEANNFKQALIHTEKQLGMLERLAVSSGEHILINPYEAHANILSQLFRYKEAGVSYKRAMDIVDRLYGSEHIGLNTLLMNCGISYYMYSQKLLRKNWSDDKQQKAITKAKDLLVQAQVMLLKGKRLLLNYDNAQVRRNLAHLEDFLKKVNRSLADLTEKEFTLEDDDSDDEF